MIASSLQYNVHKNAKTQPWGSSFHPSLPLPPSYLKKQRVKRCHCYETPWHWCPSRWRGRKSQWPPTSPHWWSRSQRPCGHFLTPPRKEVESRKSIHHSSINQQQLKHCEVMNWVHFKICPKTSTCPWGGKSCVLQQQKWLKIAHSKKKKTTKHKHKNRISQPSGHLKVAVLSLSKCGGFLLL